MSSPRRCRKRRCRRQIDATRQMIALNSKMLEIPALPKLAKGYVGRLDVAAQESQLAQVTATLPAAAQATGPAARSPGRAGRPVPEPGAGGQVHAFESAVAARPAREPSLGTGGTKAGRASGRGLTCNVASAQIGIATANRLPNIQLTADAGSTALAIGQVFKAGTGFWDLGAAITAPIFQGGTLLHQERAAKAAYVVAAEQYRSTVLTAFQNVADTLVALDQDAEGLKSAAAAAAAAKVTLDLSQRQWKAGYASYLSLSTAEQADLQAQINLVQAQANRYADTAALFQALGGGWWHRAELMQADSNPDEKMKNRFFDGKARCRTPRRMVVRS